MYQQEIMVGAIINENATTATTAVQLTAASNVCAKWVAHYPFVVQRVSFKVSTAVNDLTAGIVTANLVTGLMNSTPVTAAIGTMTIPNGATAGTVYFNNVTPVVIPVGCALQFTMKQGALGGTPAGAGFLGFYGTMQPEAMANETATTVIKVTV